MPTKDFNTVTDRIPSVSYLVPSYNHARYVIEALDSISRDPYPNKEIVIVDDGSIDESPTLLENWVSQHPNENIKYIKRENRGLCSTLNEMIDVSSGDFVRLCSSDDFLCPGSTAEILRALANHPTKIAAFGDAEVIDEEGTPIGSSAIEHNGGSRAGYRNNLASAIINNWAVSGPCLVISRHFLIKTGLRYDEKLKIDDWYMYLKLLADNGLLFVDRPVALYRIHTTNSSRTRDTNARIKNQTSQLHAARLNLPNFGGIKWLQLKAQESLIKAKIAFLRKEYGLMILNLASSSVLRLTSIPASLLNKVHYEKLAR